MTTEIIIATRNRCDKLNKTMESIRPGYWVRIFYDGYQPRFRYSGNVRHVTRAGHNGAVWSRNYLLSKTKSNIIYSTDDIIFNLDSIETAEREFEKHFPDNDGVLGFRQTGNHKFHPTGMAMVGINFLKKYPNQWLFYPGYFHFACQEILWHAEKIGKFQVGSEAVTVAHMNPIVNNQYMDRTHSDARIHKERDHKLMLERKKAGLIWGYNDFNY